MIELSVGNTWDIKQFKHICKLNRLYSAEEIRISEVYGSLRSDQLPFASARPDFRLPEISRNKFQAMIKAYTKEKIDVNYTCNAPMHSSVAELNSKRIVICDSFKYLEDSGVNRLTISNPLLIEMAIESCSLPMDVSTIINSCNISQLRVYREWRADRVCLNIYKNRDFNFLRHYFNAASNIGISPILIVNEFCMFGNTPCLGVLRDACYVHSSTGGNQEGHFDGWPFDRCHRERMNYPHSLLQSPFILPQHLNLYKEKTGIRHFKVTGRTFSTSHNCKILTAYMSRYYKGSLVHLWIDPGNSSCSEIQKKIDVKPIDLKKVNFFERWFARNESCDFSCDVICHYCKDKFTKIMEDPISR